MFVLEGYVKAEVLLRGTVWVNQTSTEGWPWRVVSAISTLKEQVSSLNQKPRGFWWEELFYALFNWLWCTKMYRTAKYLNFYVWCSHLFQLNHVHDSFLALTTDGINFIMNSQEICDVINQCHDPKEAALRISEQVRWHCYTALFFHRKSCDFLTTVYNKYIHVCCLIMYMSAGFKRYPSLESTFESDWTMWVVMLTLFFVLQALQYGSEDNSTTMVVPFGAWGKHKSSDVSFSFSRSFVSSGRFA